MRLIDSEGKSVSDLQQQATWVHHQDSSADTWTINHNLGKYPSVTCVESVFPSNVIYGNVQYVDYNTVVITFAVAITGKAFLN